MNEYDFYNTLLISEDTLKTDTELDLNLSGKYLMPVILKVQDVQLQETIGTSLYRKLQDLVYSGEITMDENVQYKYLLDVFICPMLQQYVQAQLATQMAGKIANAGVIQATDEKMYNTTASERKNIVDDFINFGDSYRKMLQKYLLNNRKQYPELADCDCEEMRAHLNTAATTSVWLGGIRGKRIERI